MNCIKYAQCDYKGGDHRGKQTCTQMKGMRCYFMVDPEQPATNSAMDAIAWLERVFKYVPDCTWRDDLRRFIEAQRRH